MGVQPIGDKKMRQASMMTGLHLVRCLRHSNRLWFGFVGTDAGHWHVRIDPVTWDWRLDREAFSSCEEFGPHIDPPLNLRRLSDAVTRSEVMEDRALRLTRTLEYYAQTSNYEEQPNWSVIGRMSLESHVPIMDDKGALARAALAAEED